MNIYFVLPYFCYISDFLCVALRGPIGWPACAAAMGLGLVNGDIIRVLCVCFFWIVEETQQIPLFFTIRLQILYEYF